MSARPDIRPSAWEEGQNASERENTALLQRAGFLGSEPAASAMGGSRGASPPVSWFDGQTAQERENTALLQRAGYIPSEMAGKLPPAWEQGLSANELVDTALLQRSGFLESETTVTLPAAWEDGLSAQERADMSVLRSAGFMRPAPVVSTVDDGASIGSSLAAIPADDTALLQAAGFMPKQSAAAETTATQPVAAFAPARSTPPPVSAPPPSTAASTSPSLTKTVKSSHQHFAILEIAPGGEAVLAALESKMGVAFAGRCLDKPYWSAASTSSGGTVRAFATGPSSQRAAIASLCGELGSPLLTLTVGPIDKLNRFVLAGPGAPAAESRGLGLPVLPPRLSDKLHSALGR